MSENVMVRTGRPEDLPQVLELIRELATHVGHSDQVKITVDQMHEDGFGTKPVYDFLVAENEGAVIGTSIYYYRFSTWKGRRLHLEDLVVRKQLRGQGVGKLLFEATMKKAIEEKCTGMFWQVAKGNSSAIEFYKKYNAEFDMEFINCGLEADEMNTILSKS